MDAFVARMRICLMAAALMLVPQALVPAVSNAQSGVPVVSNAQSGVPVVSNAQSRVSGVSSVALAKQFLMTNEFLKTNEYLVADNSAFFAIVQGDGNFCVYRGSGPADNKGSVWCARSTSAGPGPYFAIMQSDGNFCVYRGTDPASQQSAVWCRANVATPGGPFFAIMQADGAFVIDKGTGPGDNKGFVWGTGAAPLPVLTVSPAPVEGDVTAFYKQSGTYAGVSCMSNTKPDCSKSFPLGTVLRIGTYAIRPGWGFSSWTGACAGQGGTCELTMDANKTVGALFATTVLFATAPANGTITGPGINCGSTCSINIVPGTNVSVTANPSLGWAFDAWGGDCAGKPNPCSLAMTQNRSVTVSFKNVGTKIVTATRPVGGTIAGAGLNCGDGGTTCSATITTGQAIGLSATPSVGYLFASWGGACQGQGAGCSITMSANMAVSATFTFVGTAKLTVSPAPVEGDVTAFYKQSGTYAGVSCKANVKPACQGTFTKGTVLRIGTFAINSGFRFTAWTGACVGQPSWCELTMDADKTISATFGK